MRQIIVFLASLGVGYIAMANSTKPAVSPVSPISEKPLEVRNTMEVSNTNTMTFQTFFGSFEINAKGIAELSESKQPEPWFIFNRSDHLYLYSDDIIQLRKIFHNCIGKAVKNLDLIFTFSVEFPDGEIHFVVKPRNFVKSYTSDIGSEPWFNLNLYIFDKYFVPLNSLSEETVTYLKDFTHGCVTEVVESYSRGQ